jgi:hypothetical protein
MARNFEVKYMSDAKEHAVIHALKHRAEELRKIARELDVEFQESEIAESKNTVRFSFSLRKGEFIRLLEAIPDDIYAHRAYLGGGGPLGND